MEASLLKRTQGYSFDEVTKELRKNKEGKEELVVVKVVTKHVNPSDLAIIFHLKNRNPDRWSDKKEIDHRVQDISKPLTEEELRRRLVEIEGAGTGLDTKSIEGGDS